MNNRSHFASPKTFFFCLVMGLYTHFRIVAYGAKKGNQNNFVVIILSSATRDLVFTVVVKYGVNGSVFSSSFRHCSASDLLSTANKMLCSDECRRRQEICLEMCSVPQYCA